MEETAEFFDYTLATSSERLVAVIEQALRSWILTGMENIISKAFSQQRKEKPVLVKVQSIIKHKLSFRSEPYVLQLHLPTVTSIEHLVLARQVHPLQQQQAIAPDQVSLECHLPSQNSYPVEADQAFPKSISLETLELSRDFSYMQQVTVTSEENSSSQMTHYMDAPSDDHGPAHVTSKLSASSPLSPFNSAQTSALLADYQRFQSQFSAEEGSNPSSHDADSHPLSQLASTASESSSTAAQNMETPGWEVAVDLDLSSLLNDNNALLPSMPDPAVFSQSSLYTALSEAASASLTESNVSEAQRKQSSHNEEVRGKVVGEQQQVEAQQGYRPNTAQQAAQNKPELWWPRRAHHRRWWSIPRQHKLQRWFGVDAFLILQPATYSQRLLDTNEAQTLLGLLTLAASGVDLDWPLFLPVHDALRDAYLGVAAMRGATVRFSTDSIHSSYSPKPILTDPQSQLTAFAALLAPVRPRAAAACAQAAASLAKTGLAGLVSSNAGVSLTYSACFTYVVPVVGALGGAASEDEDAAAEAWDTDAAWRPWASQRDPISLLELDVVWDEEELRAAPSPASMRIPPVVGPKPHPSSAHYWLLHVLSSGGLSSAPARRFGLRAVERVRGYVELSRSGVDWLWTTARQCGPPIHGGEAFSFSAMLSMLLEGRYWALRAGSLGELMDTDWWLARGQAAPLLPPEAILQGVMADIFDIPTDAKASSDEGASCKNVADLCSCGCGQCAPALPRTAPWGSILSLIALHAMAAGNARAVAALWTCFTRELRFRHWEPCIPLPPTHAVANPASTVDIAKPGVDETTSIAETIRMGKDLDRVTVGSLAAAIAAYATENTASTVTALPASAATATNAAASNATAASGATAAAAHAAAGATAAAAPEASGATAAGATATAARAAAVATATAGNATTMGASPSASTAVTAAAGPTSPSPGMPHCCIASCLAHQKLEMLETAIQRLAATQPPSPVSRAALEGWDAGSDEYEPAGPLTCHPADDSFFSASEDEDFLGGVGKGRLVQLSSTLMRHPDRFVWVPELQPRPVYTEDELLEQRATASARAAAHRDTGNAAHDAAYRYEQDILGSAMSAFKAANPGCILSDFLGWYMPTQGTPLECQIEPDQVAESTQSDEPPAALNKSHSEEQRLSTEAGQESVDQSQVEPKQAAESPQNGEPLAAVNKLLSERQGLSTEAGQESVESQGSANTELAIGQQEPGERQGLVNIGLVESQQGPSESQGSINTGLAESQQRPAAEAVDLDEEASTSGQHMWSGLWAAAPAFSARAQRPLQDPKREGEVALHYLETLTPASLLTQLALVALGAALTTLASTRAAVLPPVHDAIERYQRFASSILGRLTRQVTDEGEVASALLALTSSGVGSLEEDEMEVLLAEFHVLEQAVVLAESLLTRLPGCSKLVAAYMSQLLTPLNVTSGPSGVMADSQAEKAIIAKIMARGCDQDLEDVQQLYDFEIGSAAASAEPSEAAWPDPSHQEWVIHCREETHGHGGSKRCDSPSSEGRHGLGARLQSRPNEDAAFNATGCNVKVEHRFYVQHADSETRIASVVMCTS